MELNANKCHVMEMMKSGRWSAWTYKMGNDVISRVNEEKYLGIVIQDNLSPEKHINKIFAVRYRMLRNIRVAFHFLDKNMMKKIITTMIRPKLEYAEIV